MRRLAFLFAITLSMCVGAADGFFVAPIFSGIYGLDGTRYVEQDGQLVEAMPMRGMALPDSAALEVAAIVSNSTNINGVAYNRIMIDFSCNFDWRGWHPYINHVSLNTQRWRLELQDEAVYLGSDKRTSNLSYAYEHHGYIVGYEPTAQVAYYEVSIDSESYDGDSGATPTYSHYIATPSGEIAAVRTQYVMIDQHGNITPSNAVATVTEAAATATRLAAAEVAAVAYTNAEAQTAAAVDDLAAAIIGNSLVVYEDDFMYSLGDAIAVS
ncbi:MAG: hypothetical protein II823_03595, partial [Kiritimatiellae bacterium]|nr:hypothetical protein [Kiritimatiellia bacterium]